MGHILASVIDIVINHKFGLIIWQVNKKVKRNPLYIIMHGHRPCKSEVWPLNHTSV